MFKSDLAGVRPQVMGILNLSPDSFYDGGRLSDPLCALDKAKQLVAEGADWLDLGGESTRPGAKAVSLEEERALVIPTLRLLKQHINIKLSIDTQKPELMAEAIDLGVDLINDVNSLMAPGAIELLAEAPGSVQICLMHKKGLPENMQQQSNYTNCLKEVSEFLSERIGSCVEAGISKARLWIDPGFGFAKLLEHNISLLKELNTFNSLGCPILVGLSRKQMLGQLTGRPVEERLAASISANLIAAIQGAKMLRVHDVAATVDSLKVFWAVQQGKQLWAS